MIYAQIQSRHALGSVRVNDIPAWRPDGSARQGAGICLEGLLHGQDRVVAVGAWTRVEAGDPGELALHLADYDPGALIGIEGRDLAEGRVEDVAANPDPAFLLTLTMDSLPPRRWRWMDAPLVSPDDAGARQFVQTMERAFLAGDADALFAAMGPVLDDRPQAFPADSVAAFMDRLRPGFGAPAVTAPDEPIRPRPLAELRLIPAADGRLLEAQDGAGEPFLVKTLPDGRRYTMPILIGRSGSDWAIYR